MRGDLLMETSALFSLEGKVAVVTGGASGIGEATARRFARAGARVVIGDVADASGVAAATGGLFVRTDVSHEAEVETLLENALRELGRLDVVVNNAGGGAGGFLATLSEPDLDRTLNVNLKGVVWGIKHAAPRIADGGSILSTASLAGLIGTPSYGAYVASKAAVIGITRTAALELAPRRVRVNCVCPGTIDTPMARKAEGEVEWRLAALLHPLGRVGRPEEVAALFHFLASDESAFITGQAIAIDGGFSAGPGLGLIGSLYEKLAGEGLPATGPGARDRDTS
jgi:NAD(P)-dependent dehydrogenase (short-subunit alcohol dehydrogenase family)